MADKIVKLKDGNDYLYPYAILRGLNSTNVLVSTTLGTTFSVASYPYTATEDCYVFLSSSGYNGAISISIDGTLLANIQIGDREQKSYRDNIIIPLQKGQLITLTKIGTGETRQIIYCNIYGVK